MICLLIFHCPHLSLYIFAKVGQEMCNIAVAIVLLHAIAYYAGYRAVAWVESYGQLRNIETHYVSSKCYIVMF